MKHLHINSDVEEKLIFSSFSRYLLPSLISLLFCQIAPFIDSLCISWANGDAALSAIGIISPIFYIFNIPAVLLGIGAAILMSELAGSGQKFKSPYVFVKAMNLMLLSGLVIMVIGLIFVKPITLFLGGMPENMEYALTYHRILLLGAPFYVFCFAGTYLLAVDNNPSLAMVGMIVSNIVNIIIDLVFVVILKKGIAAAALGTVLGQVAGCLTYSFHFIKKDRMCRFIPLQNKDIAKDYSTKRIIKGGIPEATKYLLFFVQLFVTNILMKNNSGIAGLTNSTIMANLLLVAAILVECVSESVIPFVSCAYGEKNRHNVYSVKRISLFYAFILTVPFSLSLIIYPNWFINFFQITDPDVLQVAPTGLRITAISFFLSCLNLVIINICVSANDGKTALFATILKTAGFQVPIALILNQFIPTNAPWISIVISEFLTLFYLLVIKKQYKGFFRRYPENTEILTSENLEQWKSEILPLIEKRYHYLVDDAVFIPLENTIKDNKQTNITLSISILQNDDNSRDLILRFNGKSDLLYPELKSGFTVDEQCLMHRRLVKMNSVEKNAKDECVVIMAPECFSGKRLVQCAHDAGNRVILAVVVPSEQYALMKDMLIVGECEQDGLCDRVIVKDTWQEVAKELRSTEKNIVAVIAGSELSVESAENLAHDFGLRGNDPATSKQRRNKYDMKKAIAYAGLDHAKGGIFKDLNEALEFVDKNLTYPLFIKPPEGAASHNVFKIKNREDFIEKFNIVISTLDDYKHSTDSAVVEEYIDGDEYAVNIFGDDKKIIVTSIWKYEKINNEFANNLYYNDLLMDINDPKFKALKEYAVKLYKAVGIKIGPGHAEIKLSSRGPIAIEIGARLMGSANETYTQYGTKIDSPLETLNVFKTGKSNIPDKPILYEYLGLANLPFIWSGRIKKIYGIEPIRRMKTYFTEELPIKVGDEIEPSVNLDMITCGVWLRSNNFKFIRNDEAKIHKIFKIDTE